MPLDHPRSALDMLTRFLRGEAFSDVKQSVLGAGSCSDPDMDCEAGSPCTPPSTAAVSASAAATSERASTPPPPPRIAGTPRVGKDFATVAFERSDSSSPEKESEGGKRWGDDFDVNFEVHSSPDGRRGLGPSSPISVWDLTPGRPYTFSVVAVYSPKKESGGEGLGSDPVRSSPSVGSSAVTPGCVPLGEEDGARDALDNACGGHGVCREGGEAGICVCENGYAGDDCGVLSTADIRGGGGTVGDTGGAVGTAARSDYIKKLAEGDIPMLGNSAQVRLRPRSLSLFARTFWFFRSL